MGLLWAIISWIIIGAIIGLIARAIMPGKQSMSLGLTIVLGVIGAIVGGFIGGLLGGKGISGVMNDPWSIGTILLAVVGALIVMVIYGFATKGSNRV
ncbi:GlsB/YeaQ/YmgE family stress response membrane protein [Brachybacterium muris]|uniref:Membrane protein n=1 Tax=Brachybacterium muris UCD-AY4 TaxID=1249481 RepID=A0A022L4Y1_9MICO|nr:GlsB/YeaQ/YmgE family stress response membrane protein [Brachybacterium muris]EYT50998.1 membrane protein [Brachybacterium muris UCD-AY4]MCT1654361.1 GlsB/YeaQ/YmgE family stress response membrane protein [Brachybacterium muris]